MEDLINSRSFGQLMLDIETMGNQSYSSILSIGAVEFDIDTGDTGREFHTNIDLQNCLDAGLGVSGGTIMWWLGQNEAARQDLINRPTVPLSEALAKFAAFCVPEVEVWANSPRFDCGILQNAYNKLGLNIPWNFRKERCCRTLSNFAPHILNECKSPSDVQHNALSDCYYQIRYCTKIWNALKIIWVI